MLLLDELIINNMEPLNRLKRKELGEKRPPRLEDLVESMIKRLQLTGETGREMRTILDDRFTQAKLIDLIGLLGECEKAIKRAQMKKAV